MEKNDNLTKVNTMLRALQKMSNDWTSVSEKLHSTRNGSGEYMISSTVKGAIEKALPRLTKDLIELFTELDGVSAEEYCRLLYHFCKVSLDNKHFVRVGELLRKHEGVAFVAGEDQVEVMVIRQAGGSSFVRFCLPDEGTVLDLVD